MRTRSLTLRFLNSDNPKYKKTSNSKRDINCILKVVQNKKVAGQDNIIVEMLQMAGDIGI